MTLSDKTIANAKPGAKRYEIGDDGVRGLRLSVQPSGVRSWCFRYRFGGRNRKLTLGKYPDLGLKDARNIARVKYLDVVRGADPGTEKKAARITARTDDLDLIDKVVSLFIKRHVTLHMAISTQREVIRILNNDILPAFRGRKLSSITKADIHRLLDRIADRGAPIVANRALAWFKALCNWSLGRGLIDANPCAGIGRPEPEAPRERVLDDAELAALWEAVHATEWPFCPFVLLLILTGQRLHEVSDMEWNELDLPNRIWTLPGRRAKNGVEHQIPLAEIACEILKAVPRLGDYVFALHATNPIRGFQRIKSRLDDLLPPEFAPWVMHDIRRTVASNMARLGVNLPVIEKLLNHVSGSFRGIVSTYQRYDYAEQKRQAVELWANHIGSITSGEPGGNVVPLHQ